MDMETIKRINRDALRAAKEAQGEQEGYSDLNLSNKLFKYSMAVVAAVVTYFLLKQYQPNIVKVTENGVLVYDDKRAILFAAVVGVLSLFLVHTFLL